MQGAAALAARIAGHRIPAGLRPVACGGDRAGPPVSCRFGHGRRHPEQGRVAALLAAGHTVRRIALMTGTKESSIRPHMKRIYSKRGVSRQTDLVRLVLSITEHGQPRK